MDVLKAISDRRSHRSYRKEQVPEDVLGSVLKAGLEAPSARNHQPWHFSVVQDAALIQEVHDEAAKVMEKNGSPRFSDPDFQMFYHAPTVIFLFGEKEFSWTQVDCGIAVENMGGGKPWCRKRNSGPAKGCVYGREGGHSETKAPVPGRI